ncbi:hypothetical protein CCUS01_06134 [Colletotrichum cuscutae]|uniref:Uncharacterized protein n=1 Tax=Colletotrichum cuscutae TaxID=1209917 RepID=A0AAI9Y1A4_9PEZI|nr:hypothetical protein CCUS01_06134 [Colletotrichum cuscutae]
MWPHTSRAKAQMAETSPSPFHSLTLTRFAMRQRPLGLAFATVPRRRDTTSVAEPPLLRTGRSLFRTYVPVGTPYPATLATFSLHWQDMPRIAHNNSSSARVASLPNSCRSHVAPSYNLPDPDLGEAKSRLVWWTVWTPRPPTYTVQLNSCWAERQGKIDPKCANTRRSKSRQVGALLVTFEVASPLLLDYTALLVFPPTPPLIRTAPGRDNAYTIASSANQQHLQLHTLKHMDHDDRIYRVSAFTKPGKSLSPPVGASMATPSAPASATPLKLKAFSQLGRRPVRVVNHTPIDAPCGKSKQRLFRHLQLRLTEN